MNLRTIPRSAVERSLTLTRIPVDAATRALPGQQHGIGSGVRLAVDQADAAIRSVAGKLLGDPGLSQDADARRAAVRERRRALSLRRRAQHTTAEAEAKVEDRSEQARTRRRRADAQASDRRRAARAEKQRANQNAASTARRRVQNSREVQEKVDEKIDRDAPAERLKALDSLDKANQARKQALTEHDEAERLAEAAAALKADRRED